MVFISLRPLHLVLKKDSSAFLIFEPLGGFHLACAAPPLPTRRPHRARLQQPQAQENRRPQLAGTTHTLWRRRLIPLLFSSSFFNCRRLNSETTLFFLCQKAFTTRARLQRNRSISIYIILGGWKRHLFWSQSPPIYPNILHSVVTLVVKHTR